MSDNPSYIGMLDAIATGENRGYRLLRAWAERTPDPALARLLRLVALRSHEHAALFIRRLYELGMDHQEPQSAEFDTQLSIARSNASDAEKFRRLLGYGAAEPTEDPLPDLFADKTIDIETGALLGRYIATERDSERRLRQVFRELKPRHEQDDNAPIVNLDDIYAQLDRLTRTIEELKSLTR
jgi:rubrerythrin